MRGKEKRRLGEESTAAASPESQKEEHKAEGAQEGERNKKRRKRERDQRTGTGAQSLSQMNEQKPTIKSKIQSTGETRQPVKMVKAERNDRIITQGRAPGADPKKWNFEVEYNDHFETPQQAYVDLVHVLKQAAQDLGKPFEELIVYDPYYCEGRMVSLFLQLGIRRVINQNQDFYLDLASGTVPG
jgi:hypothetical protein